MIFNSFQFLWLFPIIALIYFAINYFLCGKNNTIISNHFLLIVSYALYFKCCPVYTLILLWVTFVTFYGARFIAKRNAFGKKKYLISIFAIMTIAPLLIFKYYNFLLHTITFLFASFGIELGLSGLNWAIPLGISFFSFQAIGYLWDVYYQKIENEDNVLDYMLFVSFFPQIASGPISRYQDLMPQIKRRDAFDYKLAVIGLKQLLWGMFLKTVVADRLGLYVDTVYSHFEHYSGLTCFVASVLYSVQIYADFAGYSFMAIGVGKVLGFDLINNFNRPYFAATITDFWKRWHISLTKWLTTYVYIPLGGSHCSKMRNYLNIMITFFVSGLWHGANWTFVVWGTIHGILQIIEKHLHIQKNENVPSYITVPRILITFLMVNFAWIFFRMPSISDAIYFISRIFFVGGGLFLDTNTNTVLSLFGLCVVFVKEFCEEYKINISLFSNNHMIVRWSSYIIVALLILTIGVLDSGQFIYVSF